MNFYTIKQSAALLQVTPRTIQNWNKKGVLGFVKIGGIVRIPEEEIRVLIEKHTVKKRSKGVLT
jgi:excisionase family DNA binding protein